MKVYIVSLSGEILGVGKSEQQAQEIIKHHESNINRHSLQEASIPIKQNWKVTECELGSPNNKDLIIVWEAHVRNGKVIDVIEHWIFKEDAKHLIQEVKVWDKNNLSHYSLESPEEAKELAIAHWVLCRERD
jgi:hypothetical protein